MGRPRASWLSIALALVLASCSESVGGADGGGGRAGGPASSSAAGPASSAEGPASSASTGGTAGAGGGGADAPCDGYASAPLGVEVGDVLDPEVVLDGFVEGAAATAPFRLGELRDCDGRTGVHAVLIVGARSSCQTCRAEAETLAEESAELASVGVRTVVLLMDGDVTAWRDAFDLGEIVVLADPEGTLELPELPGSSGSVSSTPNGTPLYVVLDPRSGRIVDRHRGRDYDRGSVRALAAANAP